MKLLNDKKKTAGFGAVFFSVLAALAGMATAQELELLDRRISEIISKVSVSVVTVEARYPDNNSPILSPRCPGCSNPVNAMIGSGLLLDSMGHVLTTLDLIDGVSEFLIDMGGNPQPALLVGLDRREGLAVLKISGRRFATTLVPSPDPLLAGKLIIAYGHTTGKTGYPALGILAGPQSGGSFLMSGTTVPGLPGGGVFDLSGRLIGIVVSDRMDRFSPPGSPPSGITLLPVSIALAAAERIICCGSRDAGYLGIRTTDIELVSDSGVVIGAAVVVSDVDLNSPARRAGLTPGDIITRFNAQPISDDRELQRLVATYGSDTPASLELLRGTKHVSLTVALERTLESSPPMRRATDKTPVSRRLAASRLQREADSLHAEIRRLMFQLSDMVHQIETAR